MLWILLWVVLVLAGAAVIGWLAYGVFRKAMALLTELGHAGDRLAEVSEQARRATEGRARRAAAQAASAVTTPGGTPLSDSVPRMAVPASERL